jgi:menaquinone-9 beta-reductase
MGSFSYDVVTIGGGMGASALAGSLAKQGLRVLVLEKEIQFKDRVRGEYVVPWGVAETKALGIHAILINSCGTEVPLLDMGFGPRNLIETTPQQAGGLTFFHPDMQETLLQEAERLGAEVRRGVSVTSIEPGAEPRVTAASNGREENITARLIVAADGRGSAARKWAGFTTHKDAHPFHFAGVLMSNVAIPRDLGVFVFNAESGLIGGIVPQCKDRCRAYLGYPTDGSLALNGAQKLGMFLSLTEKVGPLFVDRYTNAKRLGPLAAFEGGYFWVDHPYRDGVVLLGEAAGTSDPTFGQGMSLALRDARVLRDALLADSNWDQAGHRYAEEHDQYFDRLRTVGCMLRSVFQERGPAADARRQKALPKITEDLTRVPDHLFGGPELPLDETVKARFYGDC